MHREEARNIANIDKVYSSSIPFLKNKFSQTQNMIEVPPTLSLDLKEKTAFKMRTVKRSQTQTR